MPRSSANLYPWRRFWCPPDGQYPSDGRGFLADWEGMPKFSLDSEILSTEELTQLDCLALLGEPGMGKSTELRAMCQRRVERAGVVFIDLRSYGSEDRLIQDIFQSP